MFKIIVILFLMNNVIARSSNCNDVVNWNEISRTKNLNLDFILSNQSCLNWNLVYQNTQFDVDFHRNNLGRFIRYKDVISKYQKLPEYFIKEQATIVNWHLISKFQELSPQFIKEMKDWVDWVLIINHQKDIKNYLPEWIC